MISEVVCGYFYTIRIPTYTSRNLLLTFNRDEIGDNTNAILYPVSKLIITKCMKIL